MLTPEQLAKPDTEHAHQTALFQWAALNTSNAPELAFMFAIPNGGERNAIVAARMVAEGARSGVLDVFLPVPRPTQFEVPTSVRYHGLFIEMKKPSERLKRGPNGPGPWDYGGVSDNQKRYLDFLTQQGYKCVVCYSWLEAADAIKRYLTGKGLTE
jgi:hypothetical protein